MSELTLKIVTPEGSRAPVSCDSIHLTVCDRADGTGGGSYGIRPGHMKALLSLEKGKLEALRNGAQVLLAECGNGFASVEKNTVTIVVEEYQQK